MHFSVFYNLGIGGRGACGYDIDQPVQSAAVSGKLFDHGPWVPSQLPDKRYVSSDPVCKGIWHLRQSCLQGQNVRVFLNYVVVALVLSLLA
jgi:hypothetical protein